MSDVLHASPETGPPAIPKHFRTCPECMTPFAPGDARQLFCSSAHRTEWNNRATVRGRVLTPYAIAARVTRDGTRGMKAAGKRASHIRNRLIQRWIEEDRDAGRMDWPRYIALRIEFGFDPQ